MKLSWLDRFVIYWYGVRQPYDEHVRAVVGRISTGALLLVVMTEFCILLAESLLNLRWLNSVALLVLYVAVIWVGLSINDAGLKRIETTAFNYHQTLKRLKWDSTRDVIIWTIATAVVEYLTGIHSGPLSNYLPNNWALKLLLALLVGIVMGVNSYFGNKKTIQIIPETD